MNPDETDGIKIYTLQEIKNQREEEMPEPRRTLTAQEIEAKLAELKDKLPFSVISELEQNLKKVKVTEQQFQEIIERVTQAYESANAKDDLEKIHQKLNELDNSVSYFVKYIENEFQKPAQGKTGAATGPGSDIISTSILLKWTEFLLSRTGEEHLGEVLQLYADLGWIDEALGSKMLLMAKGLEVQQSEGGRSKSSKLEARDHIQSLIFIERLRAVEMI